MELDNEDIVFESALAERRHKELKNSLNGVISAINSKSDNSIKEAIDKQTIAINGFVNALNNLPKPEKSEVKVETNQDKVVKSVSDMCNSILIGLNDLKEAVSAPQEKKEFEFKVTRGRYSDLIETVTAKQIK